MPPSVPLDPRVSIRSHLAFTMRVMREMRGLSQDGLAKELYATRATVQAYESGRNAPTEPFCKQLDEFFGTQAMFQSLWHHARQEHTLEWLESYFEHEDEATQIKTYHHSVVPGLLQTEAYIRARAGRLADPEDFVRQRLSRQDIITRTTDPPHLWVVIDEVVIRRPAETPEVTSEQLLHLLEMSKLPNITIQVIPGTEAPHFGLDGPITLLTMPDGRQVGYVETQIGGRLTEDPPDVTKLGLRFDLIRAKALPEGASRRLIQMTMEGIRGDSLAEE